MQYSQWSMVVLALTSGIACANTTQIELASPTSAHPAVSAVRADATAAILGACYALDTVARHECIYAAVVRGRAAKSDALN